MPQHKSKEPIIKDSQKKIMPLAIFMFALAASFYFYEFLLQVSPAIMASNLMQTFHITSTTLGIISGVYFYSYTLMQIPAGTLYDRFGARRVITAAVSICAIGALLFGLAPNVHLSGGARIFMGIGSACSYLGVLAICVRWVPTAYFAIFAGLAQTLGSLGAATGEAPLAALINHFGWRQSIIGLGGIGLVLAVIIFTLLRDRPHEHFLTMKDTAHTPIKDALKQILGRSQTWIVGLYALLIWTPIPIFASLWGVPFLMEKYHLTNVLAGSEMSMVWFGTAIGGPLAGWLALRINKRKPVLAGMAMLGLLVSLVMIYAPHLSELLIYSLLLLFGIVCGTQALTFGLVRDNNPTSIAGTAMGFNNMAIVLGGAIFQPVVGVILDHEWHGTLLHGIRVYDTSAFDISLLVVPICFVLAIIVSVFFIAPERCQLLPIQSNHNE